MNVNGAAGHGDRLEMKHHPVLAVIKQRGQMRVKQILATLTIMMSVLLVFVKPAKAITPGKTISFHEKRIESQKRIIHRAHRWQPIGNGWSVEVLISRAQIIIAKHNIVKSKHILRRLYPLIGSKSAWECIHSHEAAWDSTKNPTYDGGLQMDSGFQRTYGSDMLRKYRLPAWAWNKYDQMIVAERAHDGYAGYGPRGYHPWPTTAKMCGLL